MGSSSSSRQRRHLAPSDASLAQLVCEIERAAADDTASLAVSAAAFRRLADHCRDRIRGKAVATLGSGTGADDIVQDVLVIAWGRRATLTQIGDFLAWACGVARNLALDALRAQRGDPLHAAAPLDAARSHTDGGALTRADFERRDLFRRVRLELAALDRHDREALELHYTHGLSTQEVAAALGISRDAAQQRIHRARRRLGARARHLLPIFGVVLAVDRPVSAADAARTRVSSADAARTCASTARPRRSAGGPTTLLTAALALLAIAIVIGVRAFDDGTTIVTRRLTTPAGTTPVVARRTRSLPTDSSTTSGLPEAPQTPTHVAWLSDPDYTFWTDATQIDDAFFGASDGAVIDAYGQELLDGVSQFFFRLSECLRDDVLRISYRAGETAYPRIEIDLQFSLGPGLPAFPSRKLGARMAEQRDIAYRLPDVSLPPIGPMTLSLCIQSAFERARFPEPPGGESRTVQYHASIDYAVLLLALEQMSAVASGERQATP